MTPAERFAKFLVLEGACWDARDWVNDRGLRAAWQQCREPFWMVWLIQRVAPPEERQSWSCCAECRAEAVSRRLMRRLTARDVRRVWSADVVVPWATAYAKKRFPQLRFRKARRRP